MSSIVKCLTYEQKISLITLYKLKARTQKELSKEYGVSERTINRVLIEAGIATPVARIKGEAYQAMQLLKKYNMSVSMLRSALRTLYGY